MQTPPSFDDFETPQAPGSAGGFRRDNWLRYAAERFASVGLILLLATVAVIAKQRAYRMLLAATLLSANLALVLALLSRWRRPASGAGICSSAARSSSPRRSSSPCFRRWDYFP